MLGNNKKQPIYKHTHLNIQNAERLKPLMESAFAKELGNYSGVRSDIGEERKNFIAKQFANRMRIAEVMGTTPLNEDAQIFSNMPQISKLFESVSTPGSIIGMGNVANPMNGTSVNGGQWNPGYQPGTGDIPTYVFGLQTHLALNCIGFDLIPMIAVDTPKVVTNYVDTVYGGGPLDSADYVPSYIELTNKMFTQAFTKSKKLKRATSELILMGADKKAMKVRYMVNSTVRAAITVEVLSTGTVDVVSAAAVYTPGTTLSVKNVVDQLNVTGAKLLVTVDNTATVTDIEGLFKAGYASAVRTNIAEASTNNNKRTMTRAEHEKGPKHKLNVISMDKQFEMEGIEIEADTSNIQIKDMAAQGINVISKLYNGVQNQLVQSIDEHILDHLYALGVESAINAYRSQGINYSLYIASPANTQKLFSDVDVVYNDMLGNDVRGEMGAIKNVIQSASYENQTTHADRLYARILLVSEFIAQQNRIGEPDFIVLGGTLAACLKKNSKYSINPTTNTLTQSPELHYTGTIYDKISVYKNPRVLMSDPRILLGRRGNDTDPGAKFLAYDLAASRQTISQDTMAEKIRVWSRFAIADIGFYPETNYYTMVALNDYEWA